MDDSLSKFKKVVDAGNITKAAEELGISQPGLSAVVAGLEEKFGTPLLVRNRKGVFPTKAGRLVYDFAGGAVERLQKLTSAISKEIQRDARKINIGMIDNAGLVSVSKIYLAFLQKHPQLDVQIWVDNSKNLINLVYSGRVDFAIITKPESKLPEGIVHKVFASERLILVATPLLAQSLKTVNDLSTQKLVGYNEGSTSYVLIKSRLDELGLKPSYRSFSTSPEFMKHLILLNMGVGFLPENLVHDEICSGLLVEPGISELTITRELSLIYREDAYISSVKKEFIQELKHSYSSES
jgi:DNA-binding transcriptional LysR family regulator